MQRITSYECLTERWFRKGKNAFHSFFPHVKVLLYHRVFDYKIDPLQLAVTPQTFYNQLAYLKKKYSIISVDELTDIVANNKKITQQSIVISFDDGYADNFTEALPILESLQIPAVFFITTSKINTEELFWWDELKQLIFTNDTVPDSIYLTDKKLEKFTTREDLFYVLHDKLKYCSVALREQYLVVLRKQIPLAKTYAKKDKILSQAQIKQMSQSPLVKIAAHTINHPCLAMEDTKTQISELVDSKDQLEWLTDKEVTHFSYPFGSFTDFNNDSIETVKQSGFQLAFANYYGYTTRRSNRYIIPRIIVRNWKNEVLEKQINKLF